MKTARIVTILRTIGFAAACCAFALILCGAARAADGEFITGELTLPDETPVAGAAVSLVYSHDGSGYGDAVVAEATTNAKGVFCLPAAAMRRHIAPVMALLGAAPRWLLVARAGQNGLDVCALTSGEQKMVIGKPITLRLSVRGADDGAPIMDPEIYAVINVEGSGPRRLPMPVTGRAEDASILLTLPRRTASLEVISGNRRGQIEAAKAMDEAVYAAELNLSRPPSIAGIARLKADEKPMPGIVIICQRPRGIPTWTVTDAEGRFSLHYYEDCQAIIAADPSPEPKYAPRALPLAPSVADNSPENPLIMDLVEGLPLEGRVLRKDNQAGIPGVTVRFQQRQANATALRRTDTDGRFRDRTESAWMRVEVMDQIAGACLATLPARPRWIWVREAMALSDVELDVRDLARATIELVGADEKPVAGARVYASTATTPAAEAAPLQLLFPTLAAAAADIRLSQADGRVTLEEVPIAEPIVVYAAREANQLAAVSVIKIDAAAPDAPPLFRIVMRPTRGATIATADINGWPVPARVDVWLDLQTLLSGHAGDNIARRAEMPAIFSGNGDGRVVASNLLSGTPYRVTAQSAARVIGGGNGVETRQFQFGDGEAAPTLRIELNTRQDERPWTKDRRVPLETQLQSYGAQAKQVADTVEPHLLWIILPDGLARADKNLEHVEEYRDLLGQRNYHVSGIAFTAERVWVGADVGLFAWVRDGQYWTRVAVAPTQLDAPVTAVVLLENGVLRVTVQPRGQASTVYEYLSDEAKWRPASAPVLQ